MGVRVSMRVWLALAFAAIAALTAVAVAEVFTQRAERSFRGHARELAAGGAIAAAEAVKRALAGGDLAASVRSEAARRRMALFVFGPDGRSLTPPRSHGVRLMAVPRGEEARTAALQGHRFLATDDRGERIVVGLPLAGGRLGALVAIASRPELRTELGIVRDEIVEAALIAVGVGAVAGLLVAVLIARRLRRIAAAARAIESGSFDTRLNVGFHDEVGDLARTVDRMRSRLRASFADLEAERDRLRRLLERLHEGVVAVDRELRVLFANGVAVRMLELGSLDEGDLLPDEWHGCSLRRLVEGLFTPGASLAEARVPVGDDRTYTVVGIPPATGSRGAVLVLTDVSERERRERAEREFVTNAAHELRTPLAAITSAVEALQAGAKEDADARDRFLAVIERQAARLGRLSRALLVLARAQTRQEPVRLEPVELRPLLEEVASGLVPAPGVVVDVDCPPGLSALAQRELVEQIVSNIAGNAAKHVNEGQIVLGARPGDGRTVEIEVRDTGPGIAPDEQERVFDRFYSRDRSAGEGFGLGLAIVREATRAIGGVVELESAPSRGTTVRVKLAAAGRAS